MSPTQPLVLLSRALPDGWLGPLFERCRVASEPLEQIGFSPRLRAMLPEAEGILCTLTERVDAELLDLAPSLRVVSNLAVGVDNIDVAACTARGIAVGHTPYVLSDATADLAMALLLAAARGIVDAGRDVLAGRMGPWSPIGWLGTDLRDKTLGLVGFGPIGQQVAARARGFGLRVVYASRARKPEPEAQLGAQFVSLDELCEASDFVSIHTALAPETERLFDARRLGSLRRGVILVNTARGRILDTDALVSALDTGQVGFAALDVTDPEPLPVGHPLLTHRRCLVTPHIGSATRETRRRMAALAERNLLAGLGGQRLPHCANVEIYERHP